MSREDYIGTEDHKSCDAITIDQLKGMFKRRLYPIYPFFAKDMTNSGLFEWCRCLENYSESQIDKAISKWLRSKEGAKKSPMPGDIISLIPREVVHGGQIIGNGLGWVYWGLYQWRTIPDDEGKPTKNKRLYEISTVLMPYDKSVDDASKYFLKVVRNYFDEDSLSGYTVKKICNGTELFKVNEL